MKYVCKFNVAPIQTGCVNSKNGCFGKNTKFFQESEDFAGNRENWEIFLEARSHRVKFLGSLRFFGNVSQKFRMTFQMFGRTFIYTWHGTAQTAFARAVTPRNAIPLDIYTRNSHVRSAVTGVTGYSP